MPNLGYNSGLPWWLSTFLADILDLQNFEMTVLAKIFGLPLNHLICPRAISFYEAKFDKIKLQTPWPS